jgi:excisionase family DNA binding protein
VCLLMTETIRKCRLTCSPVPDWCRAVPGGVGVFRDMRARTEPAAVVRGRAPVSRPFFVLFVSRYYRGMNMALVERTVLPPQSSQGLGGVRAALAERVMLVGPEGQRLDLPAEVLGILRVVVDALSEGLAITIAPHHTVLSTSEAADIVGVSRPTLVRLLESGEIPFEQPGRHRRVRLADVLAYQERARRRRAAGLDQMVADAEEAGLYDLPEVPFERLPADGQ